MYCCVRVRRPSYRDQHLPIDTEMLQRWRDPSVDPETSDTHLEQQSTPSWDWRRRRKRRKIVEGGATSVASVCVLSFSIFIQRRLTHFVPHSLVSALLPSSCQRGGKRPPYFPPPTQLLRLLPALGGIISLLAKLYHANLRSCLVAPTLSPWRQVWGFLLYDSELSGNPCLVQNALWLSMETLGT